MKVCYQFELADSKALKFEIDLQRTSSCNNPTPSANWTSLEFQKCPSCPLDNTRCQSCPAAVDVEAIISDFASLISYDQAMVTVTTGGRETRRQCDIQVGLKSLLGLVMASSGCPVLSRFRGMANFHLPFSTLEETVVRTVSFYLLKKLYEAWDGATPSFDLSPLKALYCEVETVNTAFLQRVRQAAEQDANLNAVLELYADSNIVRTDLEDLLREIRPLVTGDT